MIEQFGVLVNAEKFPGRIVDAFMGGLYKLCGNQIEYAVNVIGLDDLPGQLRLIDDSSTQIALDIDGSVTDFNKSAITALLDWRSTPEERLHSTVPNIDALKTGLQDKNAIFITNRPDPNTPEAQEGILTQLKENKLRGLTPFTNIKNVVFNKFFAKRIPTAAEIATELNTPLLQGVERQNQNHGVVEAMAQVFPQAGEREIKELVFVVDAGTLESINRDLLLLKAGQAIAKNEDNVKFDNTEVQAVANMLEALKRQGHEIDRVKILLVNALQEKAKQP